MTTRQIHLLKAAAHWREYAKTAKPEGLARVSIAAAEALEREVHDGIARCACCLKPTGAKPS